MNVKMVVVALDSTCVTVLEVELLVYCVTQVSLLQQSHLTRSNTLLLSQDIDECMESPGICGVGTCNNLPVGQYYECSCPDGTMMTGSASDNTLTCTGKNFRIC